MRIFEKYITSCKQNIRQERSVLLCKEDCQKIRTLANASLLTVENINGPKSHQCKAIHSHNGALIYGANARFMFFDVVARLQTDTIFDHLSFNEFFPPNPHRFANRSRIFLFNFRNMFTTKSGKNTWPHPFTIA